MESKISTQLETTSFYFQSYIRRGLSNVATEEEEKHRASMIAEARHACKYCFNVAYNFQKRYVNNFDCVIL